MHQLNAKSVSEIGSLNQPLGRLLLSINILAGNILAGNILAGNIFGGTF